MSETPKQAEYRKAMSAFEERPVYGYLGASVAVIIVLLQFHCAFWLPWSSASWTWAFAFLLAYVLADFVNGLIHMVMDNADTYSGPIGPLVAAFHRHHHHPQYQRRPLFLVYLEENKMKNWLAVYMLGLGASVGSLTPLVAFALLAFSVLSSCAEVSHYLCHNSRDPAVKLLQRWGVLLSDDHHRIHHDQDNRHYGFLNGMTDPLIDRIAQRVYPAGYATTTDVHGRPYYESPRGP